jgi:DMSO/TMAO reductase YedYZ molybdopterin-dependent catalytic subunit
VVLGALVGALVTAPVLAVLFAAWKLSGLPFLPFAVFDRLSKVLPGPMLTFAVDSMVKVIRSLHIGPTSTVAKTAEQSMAVGLLLVAGTLAGAALFFVLRRRRVSPYGAGIAIGALAAAVAVLVTLGTYSVAGAVWIALAALAWGAALGWARARMGPTGAAADAEQVSADAEVTRVDRRRFIIRLGGATALITVVGAGVGTLVGSRSRPVAAGRGPLAQAMPNADDPVKPAPGTRPELTPLESHYRIDINTSPPELREEDWRLRVGGLVDRPLELTLDDLRRYEPMEHYVTLACISNPVGGDLIGTALWRGVSLQRLLPDLGLKGGATHLKISSADGFYETVALDTIASDARVMLAYAWDGVPLTVEHGFPLRIYIPDRYGMKQPKWIQSIEAVSQPEAGYWVKRGWDKEARMKATAVIDAIAVDMMIVQSTPSTLIPVGGIAHAGARGISRVEVRVDEGEWRPAQLRRPLSDITWVIWRYDWPFEKGKHTLTVRCFDGSGSPQIVEDAPPHPSGASGLHSKSSML